MTLLACCVAGRIWANGKTQASGCKDRAMLLEANRCIASAIRHLALQPGHEMRPIIRTPHSLQDMHDEVRTSLCSCICVNQRMHTCVSIHTYTNIIRAARFTHICMHSCTHRLLFLPVFASSSFPRVYVHAFYPYAYAPIYTTMCKVLPCPSGHSPLILMPAHESVFGGSNTCWFAYVTCTRD